MFKLAERRVDLWAVEDAGTRLTVMAMIPTGLALIIGPALISARHHPIGDAGLILVGLLPVLEGVLLATNWLGGTARLVRSLRSRSNPPMLSVVPVFVWRFAGVCVAATGVMLMGAASAWI